ncbi:MAG: hypothetical protein M1166_05060 [Candidatus Thermoplasmatota archaeon]|jgi:hypothetical protein|nr:hypothetical protein [Candidatus Thermoplasmatota archaeon]
MDIDLGNRKLLVKSKEGALLNVPVIWLKSQGLKVGNMVSVRIESNGDLVMSKVNR